MCKITWSDGSQLFIEFIIVQNTTEISMCYYCNVNHDFQNLLKVEICQELYETMKTYKGEDGRLICETFIRVPQRR